MLLQLNRRVAVLGLLLAATTTQQRVHGAASTKAKPDKEASTAKDSGSGPPAFFLQDASDSLCLSGEVFKRCSIDTLFYVVGSSGNYQIHKRPVDGTIDDEDDGICLSKKSCKDSDAGKLMDAKLTKCSHCGAKNWDILGDAETGFVVTSGGGKTCLVRQTGTNKAMTTSCDSEDVPYTPLQLQFASAADIKTMSSPGARMIGAASDGDKKSVQGLIKEGIDINVRDWDELTALIPAASGGHLDLVKYLVGQKIDVNAADKDGITALMEASIMGHAKVVEYLISSGANVSQATSFGVTALWLAASEGKSETLKLLLKKGADATNTRTDGLGAIMSAAAAGHVDACRLLLENGANPLQRDGEGLTPLMNAAENGTAPLLEILVNAAKKKDPEDDYINAVSNTGFTALIVAAANGNAPAIEWLVERGAKVDLAQEENGVTALMYAAASDHVEALDTLIKKGKADLEVRHTNGGTALLEAATGGAVKAMQTLVDAGAVYDFVDVDGVTPLMAIASQGNFDGQKVIISALQKDKKPEQVTEHINLFSYSGGSAVMFAAAGGHTNCTEQLIQLGADVKAIARATPDYAEKLKKMIEEGTIQEQEDNVDGVTALHVAAQGGHKACVDLLLEAGADVSVLDDEERSSLMLAIKGNYGSVAKALVEAGSDPNTVYVDDKKATHNLLFDAIMVENNDFALLLIEKGADIYYKDEKSVSTLLQASHRGFAKIVQALLEKHKANGKEGYIDDASEEGVSPLVAASSEGHEEVVKLLIAAKANINAADKDGTTALMAASARGHLPVAKALVSAGASVNAQNTDGHSALMFAYNGKNQVETLFERYNQFKKDEDTSALPDATAAEKKTDDDGGTGPLIREALANHTALVDLLLSNGADASLKDKEGHVAKDFDFHPDADASVMDKGAKAEKDESKYEL